MTTGRGKAPAPADLEPWERQPKESAQAFEAFAAYRDQEGKRSLRRLARTENRTVSTLAGWSTRWQWQDRIAAYQRHLDRAAIAAHVSDLQDMRRRQGQLANGFLSKVVKRLTDMTDAEVAKLTPHQVARWTEVAARLEESARVPVPALGSLDESMETALALQALSGDGRLVETYLFNRRPERWADRRSAATAYAGALAAAGEGGPADDTVRRALADKIGRMTENFAEVERLPIPGTVDTTAEEAEG